MESNVVSYILDNLFFFLPLGLSGIIITIYLFFTGKKEEIEYHEDLESDYKSILKIKLNVYVLIFSFIIVMIMIAGILSDFIIPTLIGAAIAVIPLILIILENYRSKNSKVL